MSSININPTTIGEEILVKQEHYKKLRVPDYQRNYVWDEDRIDEFWLDLTERKSLPFLGSFIIKEEANKWEYPIIDIVDWQQRTITIGLFLAALRNVAKENNAEYFSRIVQRYLEVEKKSWWYTWKFYLECRSNIQEFFEDNFLKYDWDIKRYKNKITKTQETMRNMKKNYNNIYEKISKYVEWKNDVSEVLWALLDKILTYEIVSIKVTKDEEAYIAFEIVNASWVKLENIDLLKNLFLKESYDKFSSSNEQKEQDAVKERWNRMTENIKSAATKWNVESFLKHFWSARFWYITWKELYWSYKSLINKEGVDKVSIEMEEDSSLYKDFWSPEWKTFVDKYEYNSSIIRSLNALRIFGISQAYILFLTILRYKNEIWEKKLRNMFRLIEYFHFIYSVIWKQQANKVEKKYWEYAKEFIKAVNDEKDAKDPKHDDYVQQEFDKFKSELLNLLKEYVPESDFMSWFTSFQLKNNRDIVRYILSLYEQSITSWWTEPNFETTNIEHIYPQNNTKQNEDNDLVNNIGNLMLLERDLNSKGWNLPLDQKIEIYRECNTYKQVESVINTYDSSEEINDTWTENAIKERALEMGKSIYDYIYKKGFWKM